MGSTRGVWPGGTCCWGLLAELQEASCSQALILIEDFSHPDAVGCRQSRRLLECIKGKVQIQVLHRPVREDVLVDLVLTSANEQGFMVTGVNIGSGLGCSEHALAGFVISRNMGVAKSKVRTLNFKTVNFQLFKELVDEIPWETHCPEFIPNPVLS